VKRVTILIFLAVVLVAVGGCEKKTYVLGSPEINDGNVQDANAGKIKLSFMRYLDTHVTLELEFATKLNTTPLEGFTALLTKSEYGFFYVLVQEGLYTEEIDKLEKGDRIRVYGTVGAFKLPTDDMPQMTVVIRK